MTDDTRATGASHAPPPPLISVVIPVNNAESQLPALLEALGRQTLSDASVQVVVVDDASADATAAAARVGELAEVARLFADAGVVALVSLVSPYRADRALARARHADGSLPFLEVWVSTSVEECERRDPKGLYARARRGELPNLTGVGAPYEAPEHADVEVTGKEPLEQAVASLEAALATITR